jgi:cyclophilin family peptidyl-prolyl cis-trans isomerase
MRPALLSLLLAACLAAAPPAPPDASRGVAKPVQEYALIKTRFGEIVISFFPDKAPKHVAQFKQFAREGFYDKTTFHRVVPGFMIQGGDPATKDADRSNDGLGIPGQKFLNAEISDLKHVRSMVSMARRGKDLNSATSQFFILVASKSHLDGKYTIFGRVVRGMETVDSIVAQARDKRDNPLKRIEMTVRMIDEKTFRSKTR